MTKEELHNLVERYAKLFRKDKNYYSMDYGTRFNPTRDPKTNKIKYKKSPGDNFSPFWFCGHGINGQIYKGHITKTIDVIPVEHFPNEEFYKSQLEERKKSNEVDMGIIMPPTNEKNEASFGAIDHDTYKSPEELKRVVKQIYDEKLPLAPCFSKSGGMHIYMCCKEDVPAKTIRRSLQYFNKHLKINAKEVNPKQEVLKWNKKKNRYDPGNGILLPYKSCVLIKYVLAKKGSKLSADVEYSFIKPDNAWIKNADMETGSLEEFLNYAETISVEKEWFGDQPLELEENEEVKPKKEKPNIETEERDFTESNARPLSKPLLQIVQNIKNKKEHTGGGKFDRWLVDFVYIAMNEKRSDLDIQMNLKRFEDKEGTYDKDWETYIQSKINKCRDKYDKVDPAPLREKFMQDTIYNLKAKKYYNKSTKNCYEKEPYDIKFAHIFPKKDPPTTHFKEHHNKQLAEEETYRPDLHKENEPLMKGADGLYYLNSYKPGKIKPIKPEKQKDLEPFLELMEHLVTIEKERNHVLDIMGWIIQNPWKKVKTITVIYTKHQRMGKGSLFDTLTDIVGETNAEPTDVKGILDKGVTFAEKQLILIDECKSAGDFSEKSNLINDLKKIATETRIQQRRLYVDYKVIETQTCIFVFTNLPDALNVEAEDERLFVIANENERKPMSWYKAYHKWRQDKGSSYVYWYLLNRDLSKFDPMAPPPTTEGKKAMQEETGHPLTKKLKEWIDEGRHPFNLDECVRGTTELAEYISKHDRGAHVKYANDTKQLKRSLEACGCVFIGQVLHKLRNEKPTLCLYRKQKEMLEKHKKSELCNHIWKPLRSESREAVVSERQNENFNNMDTTESDRAFEHNHMGFKKKDERGTFCWSCKQEIDTDSNEKCTVCNWGIKCACGKCACDDPRSKLYAKVHGNN
ncbi:primase-helicase family protein [Maribacter sp. UBA4516]|uniref:primase-helicase family protein n=1 Tax=Maribacter sp. UBA4516 TaxID=1946804 RepID=UPI002580117D|nr:primase-helicase family protein [Maribacter sp. UBA4516]